MSRLKALPLLPRHVANHIARACGLPRLYIGEHRGVHIEYIWAAKTYYWPEGSTGTTIVVKSNLWRVGLIDYGRRGVSAVVELFDRDDFAWKVQIIECEQLYHFPSVLDGYSVDFVYVDADGIINASLSNPNHGNVAQRRIERAYKQDTKRIIAASQVSSSLT